MERHSDQQKEQDLKNSRLGFAYGEIAVMQRLPRPRGRNHLRLQKSEDSGAAGWLQGSSGSEVYIAGSVTPTDDDAWNSGQRPEIVQGDCV